MTHAVKHLLICKAVGVLVVPVLVVPVLVVPVWPSSIFWPYLVQSDTSFKSFIVDVLYVEQGKHVFVHGNNVNSLFGSDQFSTAVVFLKLDGSLKFLGLIQWFQ